MQGKTARGTLESRVRRAVRPAGPDAQPVRGAMVHGLRRTFATELVGAEISVYTPMKLRPRINGHRAALHHRRRPRDPHCGHTKSVTRGEGDHWSEPGES